MVTTPTDRGYTKSHEWVLSAGGLLTVGITDHAQSELTDIVFVDLPKVGKSVRAGETVLTLESVKTVADVYAPAAGTVEAVNADLAKSPGLINQDPYGKGWIYRLKPSAPFDPKGLLDARSYETTLLT
jgi:glycine cleavage system H protein